MHHDIASPAELQSAGAGLGAASLSQSASTVRPKLADFRLAGTSSLISPVVVTGAVRVIEIALAILSAMVIYAIYVTETNHSTDLLYFFASATAASLMAITFHTLKLYSITAFTHVLRQASRLWLGWSLIFAILIAASFFLKVSVEFSRVWLLTWYVAGGVSLITLRLGVSGLVKSWMSEGRLTRRTVIIGGSKHGRKLIEELEASGESDIRICGVFDDRGDDRVNNDVCGYPKLGRVRDLEEFARKTRVDLIICALPITAEKRLLEIFRKLWILPADVRLAAHTSMLRFRPKAYSFIGRIPLIDVSNKPISDWDFVLKWGFDKIVGTAALIALAPIMALVALAIKLDSRGPALFRQKRYGFNNELIEVFKFRSMYVNQSDRNAAKLVTKDDPRVTRVGRFIRKTSLDELPQLFNVVMGTLSLVGPRPHALQAKAADQLYHEVVDGYFARHKVKPGITGWAQINGWRGETDTEDKIQKRVEHDIYYIENWSVFFDAYILLRTPFALLKTENAY